MSAMGWVFDLQADPDAFSDDAETAIVKRPPDRGAHNDTHVDEAAVDDSAEVANVATHAGSRALSADCH